MIMISVPILFGQVTVVAICAAVYHFLGRMDLYKENNTIQNIRELVYLLGMFTAILAVVSVFVLVWYYIMRLASPVLIGVGILFLVVFAAGILYFGIRKLKDRVMKK